jgi:putative oxidoreductase
LRREKLWQIRVSPDYHPAQVFLEDYPMAGGKKTGVDAGLLVLRLALGGIFIAHGVSKVISPGGVNGFSDFVASLGLPGFLPPYPLAVAAITAEIGGGLLVVLGLFARPAALALAVVMAVAIWKVHSKNGFWLAASAAKEGPIANGMEYCLALLSMALCIFFAGAGGISALPKKGGGGGGKPA